MTEAPTEEIPTVLEHDRNRRGLTPDEIREEAIQTPEQNRRNDMNVCDICFLSNFSKSTAQYLCYTCDKYVCTRCVGKHKSHGMIERMSDVNDRGSAIDEFVKFMKKESRREEQFDREEISFVDRVDVGHPLDRNTCLIQGICGLGNRWAMCDGRNECIKIFSPDSNRLERYIRLGSKPHDITCIEIKPECAGQYTASTRHNPDTSVSDQHLNLLAVTLPLVRLILILDVESNPAVRTKRIESNGNCRDIHFSGDKLFVEGFNNTGRHIDVISTDGVVLESVYLPLYADFRLPRIRNFAVCRRGMFIIRWNFNGISFFNTENRDIFHKTLEFISITGVSLDPDTSRVYVIGKDKQDRRYVYSFDSNLEKIVYTFATRSR